MLVAGFAVLGGTTSIGSATAQQLAQSTPDQQVEQTQDRQAAIESSVHATRAAIEAMSADDCPPVSYADVLTKPDDTALIVCFARGQINNGNVTGAVATLERILLIAPDAANVRYLYAIALYDWTTSTKRNVSSTARSYCSAQTIRLASASMSWTETRTIIPARLTWPFRR